MYGPNVFRCIFVLFTCLMTLHALIVNAIIEYLFRLYASKTAVFEDYCSCNTYKYVHVLVHICNASSNMFDMLPLLHVLYTLAQSLVEANANRTDLTAGAVAMHNTWVISKCTHLLFLFKYDSYLSYETRI